MKDGRRDGEIIYNDEEFVILDNFDVNCILYILTSSIKG